MKGDRERCLAAGMDDYLAKPIAKDAFGASLRRWGIQGGPPPDGSIDAGALAALARDGGRAGAAEPARRRCWRLFRRETPARLAAVRAAIERGDSAGCTGGRTPSRGAARRWACAICRRSA